MGYVRLFVVFGIPAIIILWIYTKINNKKSSKKSSNTFSKERYKNNTVTDNNIVQTTFNIAGVTFMDGRKSRQTALRMLKFQDPPMDGPIDFEFEDYEYEWKLAILIKANDRILGNVPADLVSEFIELRDSCSSMELGYKVSGGGDYPFGCKIVITWRF